MSHATYELQASKLEYKITSRICTATPEDNGNFTDDIGSERGKPFLRKGEHLLGDKTHYIVIYFENLLTKN